MQTKHGSLERQAVVLRGQIKTARLQLIRFERTTDKAYRKTKIKGTKQFIKSLQTELDAIETQIQNKK